MFRNTKFVVAAATALLATTVSGAAAALAPDVRCESGKLKATAVYASCLLKAESKGLLKMLSPDFSKCVEKFNAKFPKLEEQAGVGICPSEMDVADIRDLTDEYESTVALLLSGGSLPPTGLCGDGIIDGGEDCDVGDLDGETCATQGFFNGTLACAPGCSFDTSACNATRFEDIGTTILDHQTGLEWEKIPTESPIWPTPTTRTTSTLGPSARAIPRSRERSIPTSSSNSTEQSTIRRRRHSIVLPAIATGVSRPWTS
ncbi:MAG: hypothetical protein ABR587_14855 [Candidatus Binatia bacterium]